jgi:hypothetical protein
VRGGRDPLAILAEERVSLRQIAAGCIRLSRDDVPDWARVERRLLGDGAEVSEAGAVTVVGPGVGADARLVQRAREAVGGGAVVELDAGPLRLTLHLPSERVDDATRALHAALCT